MNGDRHKNKIVLMVVKVLAIFFYLNFIKLTLNSNFVGLLQSVNLTQVTLARKTKPSTYLGFSSIRRNLVNSNQIFMTIMQLLSKPTKFATMCVLVPHVHVVASIDKYVCGFSMGASTS
jgi:hypothetical protein